MTSRLKMFGLGALGCALIGGSVGTVTYLAVAGGPTVLRWETLLLVAVGTVIVSPFAAVAGLAGVACGLAIRRVTSVRSASAWRLIGLMLGAVAGIALTWFAGGALDLSAPGLVAGSACGLFLAELTDGSRRQEEK